MSVKQKNRFAVKNLVLAAMFVAMGILLPFLTVQTASKAPPQFRQRQKKSS